MTPTFEFVRHGRSRRTMIILAVIYLVLISLVIVVDAAWWLMAALALVTLPAVWDLITNPNAGLRLEPTRLCWHSGRRQGEIEFGEIDHMRFDTRWDFSVRVMAVLQSEKRVRLPFETLPPHKQLEAEFQSRGIRVERHHFSIL